MGDYRGGGAPSGPFRGGGAPDFHRGGPPRPPPPPPPAAPPPFRVDRERTCPLLLRVFPRVGGGQKEEEFEPGTPLPEQELQIYTWLDATLGELGELLRVRGLCAALRSRSPLAGLAGPARARLRRCPASDGLPLRTERGARKGSAREQAHLLALLSGQRGESNAADGRERDDGQGRSGRLRALSRRTGYALRDWRLLGGWRLRGVQRRRRGREGAVSGLARADGEG